MLPLINQQGRKPALAETLRRGDLPGRLESIRSALPPALRLRARATPAPIGNPSRLNCQLPSFCLASLTCLGEQPKMCGKCFGTGSVIGQTISHCEKSAAWVWRFRSNSCWSNITSRQQFSLGEIPPYHLLGSPVVGIDPSRLSFSASWRESRHHATPTRRSLCSDLECSHGTDFQFIRRG